MTIRNRNEKQGHLGAQMRYHCYDPCLDNDFSIGRIRNEIYQKSIKIGFFAHKLSQKLIALSQSCILHPFLCDLNRKAAKEQQNYYKLISHMLKISSTTLFLCLVLSIASCMIFQETSSAEAPSGLGFGNQSGGPITSDYLSYFTNFINSASGFYPNNITQRHIYIGTKMNETYPAGYQGFSIIEDGNTTNSDWAIRTNGYYASLASGFDKIFPDRSYFFHRYYYIGQKTLFAQGGRQGQRLQHNCREKDH